MGILHDLVSKLQGFEESAHSEPAAAENSQEGSDLFLEINQLSTAEANKEQVGKGSLLTFIGWKMKNTFYSIYSISTDFQMTDAFLAPLCLGPCFGPWLDLQASVFAAVVSGSGAGCSASSHSEPRQAEAHVRSAE